MPNRNGFRVIQVLSAAALIALCAARAPAVIIITEILYHPPGGGSTLEFIEIHNETPDPMDITGYYFTAGIDFTFTERTFLDPGAYIVVCADVDQVKSVYGITNAVGNWNRDTALDNGGERISLANPAGVVEASVSYNDRGKWPSGADGTGHSLEIISPYMEMDDPDSWALSGELGGSPGKANTASADGPPIRVNEALTRAAARWVELYNASGAPVELSGYYISTNPSNLQQAAIPPGTSLAPGQWLTLGDAQLGLDFTPDLTGRTWIGLVAPAGNKVIDARTFAPTHDDRSEARIPDGGSVFSEAADPTPGAANGYAVVEDIVINEVHYHPLDNEANEYVELYNRGSAAVDLTGWSFTDGINFDLPPGQIIGPDSFLVIAKEPEQVRSTYGLSSTQVIGPADSLAWDRFGVLSNEGERVTLSDPLGNIADTVRYEDGGEWPAWSDAGGSSMELIDPFQENSAPGAWDASDDSSRSVARKYEYKGMYTGADASGSTAEFHILLAGAGITLVDDLKMISRTRTVEPLSIYIESGEVWKYFKGLSEPSDPPTRWTEMDFDDSTWLSGPTVIGFGEASPGTPLDDMKGAYSSFYVRKDFQVPDPAAVENLVLEIEYDDGYAAYLNGTEIASNNLRPDGRAFNSTAIGSRENAKDILDLTDRKDLLVSGRNVISVQVHNATLLGSDARFTARLLNGHFSITEGTNLFRDGVFDTDAFKPNYLIEGNHIRSGRTAVDPITGAGSLKVIATGDGDNKVNRIETSNTGLGAAVSRVEYEISFNARWIVGAPTLLTHGAYVGSSPPSYAASTRLDIPVGGTPGAVNSVTRRQIALTGSSNVGPVITRVKHAPVVPAADEPVTVSARIRDSDPITEATLFYSIDAPKPAGDPLLLSVTMADPDGDGIYTAEVPGQILKKRVVFFITAKDSKGQSGRFPRDHASRTHPLLLDPAAATPNDHDYVVYRHDTVPPPGRIHSYRFWVHTGIETYLSSRRLLSNDLVDSTFIFNNRDVYYNTKLRFSGSPFARQAWSESYRIRMPADKPLHGAIESFNLEDHQNGGARVGNERISHYLIRYNQGPTRAPYSIQWLVQHQVNDRVNEIREHVQTPNAEFIQRWWPEDTVRHFFEMDDRHIINDGGTRDGNADGRLLYPPYGPTTLGADKEQYRYYFNPRLDEDLDDFSELIEFAKVMTPTITPNDQFDQVIWDTADVEALCRVWAIRLNTDDWDQWSGTRGKNCYLYKGDVSGLWYLLPWDMELTYAPGGTGSFMPPALTPSSSPPYNPGSFLEVNRMLSRPAVKRVFYGVMKEMLNKQFHSAFLSPFMAKLDTVGVTNTAIGKPGGFIDQRRNQLLSRVNPVSSPAVDFVVTTNGGAAITQEGSRLVLDGKAPVDIVRIIAASNGKELDPPLQVAFSSTDVLGWQASGFLPVGENRLVLVGLNGEGSIVDTVEITVTVTPGRGLFIRGDADVNGEPNVTDAVVVLRHLFQGASAPPCLDAADADDTGVLDLTDAVYLLRALFQGGTAPPAPYPERGTDVTADELDCGAGLE